MTTKQRNVKSDKRRYLLPKELEQFLQASKKMEYSTRDQLLCYMSFKHGLRVSELINIQIKDLHLDTGHIWINRIKGSLSTMQRMDEKELRLLKRYMKIRKSNLPYLFISSQGTPFTRQAINYLFKVIGEKAKLQIRVTPHMLRHTCGYHLVNNETGSRDLRLIQDYLGHRDPKHTVRYTAINPARFDDIW